MLQRQETIVEESSAGSSPSNTSSEDSSVAVSSFTFRPCSVDLRFVNVGYGVKIKGKQQTILQQLSGAFEAGKLHGIMGPSGAGKSSLLNVLAGFNQSTSGEMNVNGERIPANNCSKMMSSISSYIMQHDFLLAELKTRETLTFAAKLKVPKSIDEKTQKQLVEDLLKRIGLSDVADRSIWKLSGGQRKRVAVAVELINYPPVIFLDEPTSGLDSTSCYRMIELLKAVANVGCNVIATIHQPNSRVFRMFDSLYVLASGGRLAYSGAPLSLANSLHHVGVKCGEFENQADILFEKGNIAKLCNRRSHKLGRLASFGEVEDKDEPPAGVLNSKDMLMPLTNFRGEYDPQKARHQLLKATLSRQRSMAKLSKLRGDELIEYCSGQRATEKSKFGILLYRWILQGRRDVVYFWGRFIAYTVCCLIFGLTFQNVGDDATKVLINIPYLYLMSMLPHMGISLVTIMHFPVTFNVLVRENINSWYSVTSFYFTRAIIDNVLVILVSATFPNVMWLLSGQLQWSGVAVPMNALIMTILSLTTHHFSYIIAMVGDEKSLTYLPFSIAMLHTIFTGFMVPINGMPLWIRWMGYLYYGQYSYRALARVAYGALFPEGSPHGGSVQLPCNTPFAFIHPMCVFKNGDMVLEHLMKIFPSDSTLELDLMAMVLWYIFYLLLGWLLLMLRVRSARKALARA